MVEIELRPRRRARRVRRARRALGRRADLATGAVVTVVVAGSVLVSVASLDDATDRRTTIASGVLPALGPGPATGPSDTDPPDPADPVDPADRGSAGDPDPDPDPDPDRAVALDPGRIAEPGAGATASAALLAAPVSPTQPDPPADGASDGRLTRLVDPLVAPVTDLLPLLAPVRTTLRQVTDCADAASSGSTPGPGGACGVRAWRP